MKEIKLTKGKTTLVDDEDFEHLSQWKWYAHESKGEFYARRDIKTKTINRKVIYMHRYLMNLTSDDQFDVDHENHNSLDNRKNNLRICPHKENQRNRRSARNSSSKYLGVSWDKIRQKWIAGLQVNRKRIYLGGFESETDAALAYNKKAKELFGEFANLNTF